MPTGREHECVHVCARLCADVCARAGVFYVGGLFPNRLIAIDSFQSGFNCMLSNMILTIENTY